MVYPPQGGAATAAGAVLLAEQYGEATIPAGADQVNITLSAVNQANTFVAILPRGDDAGNDGTLHNAVEALLTTATNLRVLRNTTTGGNLVFSYYVVEFASAVTVQQVSGTVLSGATAQNATISAVDLARTFVLCTWRTNGNSTYWDDVRIQAKLTTATNLQFVRSGTAWDVPATAFVVEFA